MVRPGDAVFLLRKWYVDLTEPNGATTIAYWADLRLGRLTRRGSALFSHGGEDPGWRFGVPGPAGPRERDGLLEWESPEAGFAVQVRTVSPPFEQRLLSTPEGSLTWRVVAPLGEATIRLDGWRVLSAPGYAEQIQLAIPPWRLPFDLLRWGRFHSPPHSLVWVAWEGAHPLRIVLRNGVPAPSLSLDDREIRLPGEVLSLQDPSPMMQGDLSQILAPSALRPLVRRLAGIRQTRWLSRGALDGGSGPGIEGWAVHEVLHRGAGNA